MLTTWINETTCGETSRRTWATLSSFAIQATGVGIALLLPMIYTQGLPQLKILSQALIATPAPPPGAPPEMASSRASNVIVSNLRDGHLMLPGRIPRSVISIDDQGVAPSSATEWVSGSTGTGTDPNGVLHSILSGTGLTAAPPKPAAVAHNVLRFSVMMQGYLVRRVEPVYPALAKAARIQGPVHLQAMISRAETSLETLTREQVDSWAGKDLDLQIGPRRLAFTSETLILSFSLPNFYFHCTTAYDILRHCGVELGKRDFMGTPVNL